MTTERSVDDCQVSEDWLLGERKKFESFCNENLQEFAATCLLEVNWLKSYLADIILHLSETSHDKPPECTSQDHLYDVRHGIFGNRKHNADPETFLSSNSSSTMQTDGIMISDSQYSMEQDKDLKSGMFEEHENTKSERKKTLDNLGPFRIGRDTESRNLVPSRDCIKLPSIVNDPPRKKTFPKRLAQSKPEIKSLILAAAAAKKEQEEQEKKSERIKEWEAKRLAASQRRQEEEQKRLQNAKQREEEWKRKANFTQETKKKENDGSRKKRTDKFLPKKKKDVDMQQKNFDFLFNQRSDLPELNWNARANDECLYACQAEPPNLLPVNSDAHMSGDEIGIILTDEIEVSKSASIAKTSHSQEEMNKYKEDESFLEYLCLTEEASESSSIEEEVDTSKLPVWCKPSNLTAALIRQATIDPESIFGKIQPLNMEKIFKGRERKFRQRSSSANWLGGDALTVQEEIEYKIRMGFK